MALKAHYETSLVSAVSFYRIAADEGQNGAAAAVLWGHYEASGDTSASATYQRLALERLGDAAWLVWASHPSGLADPDARAIRVVERLRYATAQGSSAAEQRLAELLDTLHMEASSGNAHARFVLGRLS